MGYRKVRTPGGRVVLHRVKKKGQKHHCALCGRPLAGGWGDAKTEKRPEAPFGGVLCGSCRKRVFETLGLIKAGVMDLNDVDMSVRKYVEVML